ncbi:putative secreted penicillin-binding protein [Janibacter sp. HTCC2649]|uniref:transglycosylase domain-containing protein n=1 Tax=Janibacter sp. HTCC2649 TaxID=313589 RepID=UPI0000671939|nr:transglycosylase domain-containing protein [Janibacter sp. HTCC2649]EAP98001.1 putative secreted penicillin-binding protein [Janibacter sp. HTCC2649]
MSNAPRSRAEARRLNEASPRRSSKGARRAWPRRILYTLIGLFVLGVAGVGVAYTLTDVPKPNDLAVAQTNVFYYADGKTEIGRISDQNRENVELKQIPLPVQHAMIAAEDRNFYKNNGISPTGIARAVWVAVKGGAATQGGSTITQQYVKNYFLSQDRTLSRKAREILISVKIDGQQSKDEILQNYFNTIYYGRGAYGIQTAAKAYFGKDVSKLTPAEGAFLAAAIRGPSFYDPRLGADQKKNAQNRSAYILDAMVTEGWLTPEQRAAATFPTDKEFIPYKAPSATGTKGYVMELVKSELAKKLKLTEADLSRGGLRVVTTIDKKKQDAAEEAVKDRIPKESKDLHVGLASIKPGDGAVEALYGGADYAKNQFNTATDATMQAGSTFKVFALIAALQSGDLSIRNSFNGSSPQYFEKFSNPGGATDFNRRGGVKNFNNTDWGRITVPTATANSVNTVYAQINILAGPKNTAAAATKAGVTAKLDVNYANVLGTDNVKVIDMANAYATLAAKGRKATPYYVKSVTSTDGSFNYKAKPVTTEVFDPKLVSDVVYCMQQVIERGSGEYAGGRLDREAAGKTGTSSDNYSAWFDGFTPQLATAVGMYKGDGKQVEANQMNDVPGYGAITGATIPVRIWTDFMTSATEGMEKLKFPEPSYINKNAAPKQTQKPSNTGGNTGGNTGSTPRPTTQAPSSTTPPPTPTPTPSPTETTKTPKPTKSPRPTVPLPTLTPQTAPAGTNEQTG